MKTLLCLLACASSAGLAQTRPDARDLLVRSGGPIFTASTIHLAGTVVIETTAPTSQRIESSFVTESKRGGKIRRELKTGGNTILQIFDGSNIWKYTSATNSYTKSLAAAPFANEELNLLEYGRNSAHIVSAGLEREEQLTFGGQSSSCYVVRAIYEGTPASPSATHAVRTVWISRDRDLVLRDIWELETSLITSVAKVVETVNYTTVEWDVPLADDRFAFNQPPGSHAAAANGMASSSAPLPNLGPTSPEPVPVSLADPEYSAEARAAKLQGIVHVYLEAGPDGIPSNIQVMHGLGMGLDEKAVDAIQKSHFSPGIQSAEVRFHLDDGSPWRIQLAAYAGTTGDPSGRAEILSSKAVLAQYVSPDPAACPADGGFTVVSLSVGDDGLPHSVKPQNANDPMSQAAARAVASWQFLPALARGKRKPDNAWIEFACAPSNPAATDVRLYRFGPGVISPVPVFKPEPEYSEVARQAKLQGVATLSIEIDASGHTRRIRVIRALGLGLDEKAMESVARWRFTPATRDGRPVAVQASVSVNFRLL